MDAIGARYDPLLDPDAQGCPHGCGRLTDDPYGGPCSRCWAALDDYDSGAGWNRVADAMDRGEWW